MPGKSRRIARGYRGVVLAAACVAVVLGIPEVAWGGGTAHSASAPSASTADAKALSPVVRVKPVYPPEAQYKGYQGAVTVCFTVTARGTVTDLRRAGYANLVAPAGTDAPASATARAAEARTLLGAAAVATVRKWRFVPRKRDGKPIATPDVCQDVKFRISRGEPAPGVVKAVQKAAAAGSASAQLKLSGYFTNGFGVKKDPAKALMWARKAAKQGNAFAQAWLGMLYMGNGGAWPSAAKAARWIRKSAAQGSAFGEWLLGTLYGLGKGVPQDWELAAHWYRKSAKQGNPQAAAFLGRLYEYGRGVPKDCQLAFYWFTKGAQEGSRSARKALESFGTKGDACHVHPT